MLMWAMIEMRDAALERHELLVNFWHPPGPERVAAMARHVAIVNGVYWFLRGK